MKMKREVITLEDIQKYLSKNIKGGPLVWLSLDEKKKIHVHFLHPDIVMKKLKEQLERAIEEASKKSDIDFHLIYDKEGPIGPSRGLYDLVALPVDAEKVKNFLAKADMEPEDIRKLFDFIKKALIELYGRSDYGASID